MEKEVKKVDVKQQGNIVDIAMQMFASGIEKNVAEIALKNMQYDRSVINDVIEKVYGKDESFRKYYNDRITKFGSFNEKLRNTLKADSSLFAGKALDMLGFLEGLYPISKIENNSTLVYEAANFFVMKLSEYKDTVEVVADYIKEVVNTISSDTYAIEAMRLIAGCKRYSNDLLAASVNAVCEALEENIGKRDSERLPLEKVVEGYTQIPLIKKYIDKVTPVKIECNRKNVDVYLVPAILEDNGSVLFFMKDKFYVLESSTDSLREVSMRYLDKTNNRDIRFMSMIEGLKSFRHEGNQFTYENVIKLKANGSFTIGESEYFDLSGYVIGEALHRLQVTSRIPFDEHKMYDVIENRMFLRDLSDIVKYEAFANDVNSNMVIFLEKKYNRNRYCVFYIGENGSMLKEYKDLNQATIDMAKWTSLDMKTLLREKLIEYNGNSATNEVKKLVYDHNIEILQNLMNVTEGLSPKDDKQKEQLKEVRRMISEYTSKLQISKDSL